MPDKPQDFSALPADGAAVGPPREGAPRQGAAGGEPGHMQDVEAQMRRALGLFGAPRRPEPERSAQPAAPRTPDRFGAAGHKRRFVQDGEVPVTVLHGRREHPATEAPGANRQDTAAAEAALNDEKAARLKAEREANATIHDLQTKLGHANLAQQELQAAAQRNQATIATQQAELRELTERLAQAEQRLGAAEEEFAAEHETRLAVERALRLAEAAREDAERLVRELDLNSTGPIDLPARRPGRPPRSKDADPTRAPARSRTTGEAGEPEPVQWWLMPEKKGRRR
jgi:hypothetical protein